MKKSIIIITALTLMFLLTACSGLEDDGTAVELYYRTQTVTYGKENSLIAAETRYYTDTANITQIIDTYVRGPSKDHLLSPFPNELEIKELTINATSADIVFSDQLADLSGIDLTIACACLQKTMHALTGVKEITISAENTLINSQEKITITDNSLILLDNEKVNSSYLGATP